MTSRTIDNVSSVMKTGVLTAQLFPSKTTRPSCLSQQFQQQTRQQQRQQL
jgi:hypothetical protein